MSGTHHAYNRFGRQGNEFFPQPWKKGPKEPHQHKVSHGYWSLNPDSVRRDDRWVWTHSSEYKAPFIPDPIQEQPLFNLLQNAFLPMGYAPTHKSNQPSMNPLVLAGVAVAAYLLLKK